MSKSRKVLGALLAVVMVLSVLSISAFAAGATSYEEDASFTQNWSLGTPTKVSGNQYKVDVILSTNYEVGPVSFKLQGVTSVDNVAVGAGYYTGALTDKANNGLVLMVPNTNGQTVVAKSCNNAVIATVTYTTSAANGAVTIANDPKNASNPGGSLVAGRCTAGTVNASNFVVGQVAYVDGQTVNPPAADDVELIGKNGAIVDEARGYVYGIPFATTNAKFSNYLSTTGVFELVDISGDGGYGSGDKINLYADESKTEPIKSYTLVIFGDLDGNGVVDVTDFGIMEKHVTASLLISDPVILFAADLDSPSADVTAQSIDVTDFGLMEKHVTAALLFKSEEIRTAA
jgi:hypothetical protein